jgi:NADH-quinone oxidoreductase subunit N
MLTNQLNNILDSLSGLNFEISLAAGALILLMVGLVWNQTLVSRVTYVVIILVAMWLVQVDGVSGFLFDETLVTDSMGQIMKLLFGVTSLWIVFFPTAEKHRSEYYFLILSLILGSTLMLSVNHLLVIYLAVELTSFSAYMLTNFNFRKGAFEAGMKYLIFGGVTSALALYGMSLIYGFTGTLSLSEMDLHLTGDPVLLNVGILLFIGGVLFKVSAVPFHIWVPSAYQVAPTDAVMVLSVVPKLGGFVLLHRILMTVGVQELYWLYVTISVIGIFTIVLGTLGALGQTNVKRMIAYGAIAHSGFILVTLLIPFENGAVAFAWYAVVYAMMNVAVFYLVSVFEIHGKTEISHFSGLSKTEAYMGGLMVVVMIALIGLPPTVGFTAKFYLFTVMWDWYQQVGDPVMLTYLIVAILSVIFSLFFYLKIPYFFFLKQEKSDLQVGIPVSQRIIATIFTSGLLWFFFRPEILNNIAEIIKFLDW